VPRDYCFRTNDIDECRDYILADTGILAFNGGGRRGGMLTFAHHQCDVGRMSLNVADLFCSDGFTITKQGPAAFYSFQFLLEGTCQLKGSFGTAVAKPGDVFIVDPDHATKELWSERCLQLLLRVDRNIIEQAASAELGKGLSRRLVFDPVGADPGIRSWLQHIIGSRSGGAADSLLEDRRVIKSVENTLVAMLLAGLRHSESDDLARQSHGVAPYYVKRAEEYIHTHARDDVTVEEISAAAGVSARTLFYGFKRWRSKTPMSYLRDFRLDLARNELERAQRMGGTLSQAALNAGFTNLSQFSRIYKARFGEKPSATLMND